MNQRFDTPEKQTEAIRSDIDTTRQRMDETIDAISDRLKGRHLVDEVVGFFRSNSNNAVAAEKARQIKDKIAGSTSSAVHSIVDTVKAHPLPTLLIGAGVAWMIYESTRSKNEIGTTSDYEYGEDYLGYSPSQDQPPLGYTTEQLNQAQGFEGGYASGPLGEFAESGAGYEESAIGAAGSSKLQNAKDAVSQKAGQAKQKIQQTASQVRQRASEVGSRVRQRAGEVGTRVQETAQQAYARSRERVSSTVESHPLEVGLGLLAIGVLAGLALPTPQKVNQIAGPTSDRLRRRVKDMGRDVVDRSKHVVEATTNALKEEAQAQGLTPEALREKAGLIANRTKQAAKDTARQEGAALTGSEQPRDAGNQAGSTQPPVTSPSF